MRSVELQSYTFITLKNVNYIHYIITFIIR